MPQTRLDLEAAAPSWCTNGLRIGVAMGRRQARQGAFTLATAVIRVQVIAAARTADQVAIVEQALVDQCHGIAGHRQLLRQAPAGRQGLILGETAGKNGGHQRLAQLLLQPTLLVEIQVVEVVDHGHCRSTCCTHHEAISEPWPALQAGQANAPNCTYCPTLCALYGEKQPPGTPIASQSICRPLEL